MIDEKDQQGWVFDQGADDLLPDVDAEVAPQQDEPTPKPKQQEQAAPEKRPASPVEDEIDLGEALDELDVPTAVEDAPVAASPSMPPKRQQKEEAPAQKPAAAKPAAPAVDTPVDDEVEGDFDQVTKPAAAKPTPGFATTDMGRPVSAEDAGIDTSRPEHEQFYLRVLHTLAESEDLGVDTLAKTRIREMRADAAIIPQLAVRDLVNEHLIDRTQLARAIARSQGRLEILTMQDMPEGAKELQKELDTRALSLLRERRVIPLRRRLDERGANELHLAHENSMRDLVLEAALLEIMPGHHFVWHYINRDVIGQYWLSNEDGADVDEGMEAETLLERIITTAIDAKASDIHVDPSMKSDNKATIKYRIDGLVRPKEVISLEQLDRLRIRIENIARMPKVNLNHPNKGAFSRGGFDWRVQVQPHAGRSGPVPRIVVRRLNPDSLPMEKLGYPPYFFKKIKAAAQASNGVIFWTGPTGSGKTESIHSAVISVDPMARGLSVHTIEDPPEKRVEGYAVQMEVAEGDPARSGLALLKSSLRADPDVIIFGEVRDAEMAKLVFEAANTGHLVFSTLHTNTSVDAIVRLDEIGIHGFLVSYIRGIAAQRLVRRLCSHCRQPAPHVDDWTKFCFDKYSVPLEGAQLFKANTEGCPNCNFSGYKGRIAIAEWLVPNKEIVDATAARQFENLEDIALRAGWAPMGKMAVEHVKAGITDCEEISRVVLELSMHVREEDKE